MGEIDFQTTGLEAAQADFKKGLLLLHSFEYPDAREAFLEAQEIDSTYAMAYWGEAMTYNHGLWRQQDYEEGKAALLKLGETPELRLAKAGTPLEKDLLQATEILYGEGTKQERDQAYSEYLGTLYEKYKGNQEVAAFYALSLLGAVPVGRDEEAYGKGARVAQGILNENPNHPGALHYLIHSYDDPDHAMLALSAAKSYSKVAPDAEHALHMPSHIYVALGMWKEVVASNEASYAASVKRMEEKGLNNDARGYHAFHWLLYGYLQQGRLQDARKILTDVQSYVQDTSSKRGRGYLIEMKATYLMETDDWSGDFVDLDAEKEDLNIVTQTLFHFVEGMKAFHQNDADQLAATIKLMEKNRKTASLLVTNKGIPMCSASANRQVPNQLDLDQAEILEMELRAFEGWLKGDKAQTESWLKKATEKEDNISYAYGPPTIAKPTHELYGDWLLEQGKAQAALEQFDAALYRGPKRVHALKGKMQAAKMLGDEALIQEIETIFQEIQEGIGGKSI
ncbi:MAG: hypothetical protein DHS20C18_37060 [Saprospiraceae bacterium]|nr:MAG: hypothetical protein DHS20C18_37060 [Saprospiraceae bacterium]